MFEPILPGNVREDSCVLGYPHTPPHCGDTFILHNPLYSQRLCYVRAFVRTPDFGRFSTARTARVV